MGDAAWRVRVQFATDEDADRFLAWWKASTLATSEGSEPSGDGSLKFFYVDDRAHAVELASALLPELSALPIATGSVNVDQWLMDERRWSDESLLADDEDDAEIEALRNETKWEARGLALDDMRSPNRPGWVDGIIDGLLGGR